MAAANCDSLRWCKRKLYSIQSIEWNQCGNFENKSIGFKWKRNADETAPHRMLFIHAKFCEIDVNIGCNHRTWLMPMLDENRMDWFGFCICSKWIGKDQALLWAKFGLLLVWKTKRHSVGVDNALDAHSI